MGRISRFAGALTTGLLVVGGLWYFRPVGPKAPLDAPAETPRRGGQLVATVRAEPRSFNRIAVRTQSADLLSALTQARLVRVNRATFELEPWLAERWDSSPDGLTHTLHLRTGVTWSDGTPFTSAEDVVFSLQAATTRKVSALASVPGRRRQADHRHRAGRAHRARDLCRPVGSRAAAARRAAHPAEAQAGSGLSRPARSPRRGSMQTPPAEVVGPGPFVFATTSRASAWSSTATRATGARRPTATPLPYLDRIVLEIVPDQNAELLRLQSGAERPAAGRDLRPEDYVPVRRSEEQGALKLVGAGRRPDADALWFCLKPEAKRKDPRFAFVQRQASSARRCRTRSTARRSRRPCSLARPCRCGARSRRATRRGSSPNVPRYPYDVAKARALLLASASRIATATASSRTHEGTEARFTVITQRGLGWYERGTDGAARRRRSRLAWPSTSRRSRSAR